MSNAAVMVDDRDTGLVIGTALECAGFATRRFDSALAVLRGVKRDDFRLIVLDADRRPCDAGCDWQSILDWRRNWLNPRVAVLAVGADDAESAARALEAGADDYIARPVRAAELLARIHAALRRSDVAGDGRALDVCGCTIDRETSSLRSGRSAVALTSRELGVLQILFENLGRTVTRQRLAAEVWGARSDLSGRTIEQHVYQIRRKLRRCAGTALTVRSVYGCGYQLDAAAPAAPARGAERFVQPADGGNR